MAAIIRGFLFQPALALAVLCVGQQSVAQVPASPTIPMYFGLPLPLLPGERVVHSANGCGFLVDAETGQQYLDQIRSADWYGACRFGLAHGVGAFYWDKSRAPLARMMWYGKFQYVVGIGDTMMNRPIELAEGGRFWAVVTDQKSSATEISNRGVIDRPSSQLSKIGYTRELKNRSELVDFKFVEKTCNKMDINRKNLINTEISKETMANFHKICGKDLRPYSGNTIYVVETGYLLQNNSTGTWVDEKSNRGKGNPHFTWDFCPESKWESCIPLWVKANAPFRERFMLVNDTADKERAAELATLNSRFAPIEAALAARAAQMSSKSAGATGQ